MSNDINITHLLNTINLTKRLIMSSKKVTKKSVQMTVFEHLKSLSEMRERVCAEFESERFRMNHNFKKIHTLIDLMKHKSSLILERHESLSREVEHVFKLSVEISLILAEQI